MNENSNVSYVAHIGGLISGIIIGAAYKRFLGRRIDALFIQAETKQSVESYMDQGTQKLAELDLKGCWKTSGNPLPKNTLRYLKSMNPLPETQS